MRYALDSGVADAIGLRRDFMLAFPEGKVQRSKRPRPLSDDVFEHLISPANMELLAARDPNDFGIEDIWFIQIRVGRRIGEVVNLRYDCVSEHLVRKYAWFDMTKVNQLDYGVLIPDDVFWVIRERQKKTAERYRTKYGVAPTGKTTQKIALFPSTTQNSHFLNAIAIATFHSRFKKWLEDIELPGHVSHQARHTLATRLVDAGAPMVVVKQILGHYAGDLVNRGLSGGRVAESGEQSVENFLAAELSFLSDISALRLQPRAEFDGGLEESAGFADRFEVAVQADGSGAEAVAAHSAVHFDTELAHFGAFGVGGQCARLVVEGFDLFADGEVFVGDGAVGDSGEHEGHPHRSVSQQRGQGFEGHAAVDRLGRQGMPEAKGRNMADASCFRDFGTARSTRPSPMRWPCATNR